MKKKKNELGTVFELLKNIGIIAGSIGSLAVLFLWIGNAIIVARLREYNLYGFVNYTDEYVKEAGYQFLKDIFTFFQQWELILLFIIVITLVVALMPIGPFSQDSKRLLSAKGSFIVSKLAEFLLSARQRGIHYALFLCLALSASVSLTSDWGVKNLFSDIMYQERLLSGTMNLMKDKLPTFTLKKSLSTNEFEKRFYNELTLGEIPTNDWLCQSLAEFYNYNSCTSEDDLLRKMVEQFQKDFHINELLDLNKDFENSTTFQTLLNIRLNKKLNKKLYDAVQSAFIDIKQLLSANMAYEEDFTSLVVVPANYKIVNDSIHKVQMLRKNILAFFKHKNNVAEEILSNLDKIEPIEFGSKRLSYSFWVLIGLLVYLLMNVSMILKFKQWEIGYFFMMLLFFLTIAITLPTAYGRYKFEFNIQKLNDIIFTVDGKTDEENPIKKKLNELSKNKSTLYILGPTKGKEIILGAIKSEKDPHISAPQIILLDRDIYKFINVEPVRVEDIPQIIRLLRYRKKEISLEEEIKNGG